MPIYQFECPKCEKLFDELILPKEVADVENGSYLSTCPVCGSVGERTVTKANFATKPGRGFYGSKPKA